MSVYKKLMQARLDLQGRKLNKSGHNKFAGYYYFELGDFLPVVQEIFAKLDLCGVVSYATDVATLKIVDLEDSTTIEITSPMSSAALKGCHEVQNLGAVQTYLRRYLWVTAMEIVEHDALDSSAGVDKPERKEVKMVIKTPALPKVDVDPETQAYLREMAMEAIAAVKAGTPRVAFELIEHEHLDNDQKTALWGMLDSSTRSAIKTAKTLPL